MTGSVLWSQLFCYVSNKAQQHHVRVYIMCTSVPQCDSNWQANKTKRWQVKLVPANNFQQDLRHRKLYQQMFNCVWHRIQNLQKVFEVGIQTSEFLANVKLIYKQELFISRQVLSIIRFETVNLFIDTLEYSVYHSVLMKYYRN